MHRHLRRPSGGGSVDHDPRRGQVAHGPVPVRPPRALTAMVGTEPAVVAVVEYLKTAPLLTLVGPPGVGKSRLAMEMARRTETDYSDGQCWVELDAVMAPEEVPRVAANALRVPRHGQSALDAVTAHLRGKNLLLLLDTAEHVASACGKFAGHLAAECPHLTILVTSRTPLGAGGERLWPVAPLSTQDEGGSTGGGRCPAVEFFCSRATLIRPGFVLDAGTEAVVAEICQRLDGLPLAIDLAAGRLATLSPVEIAHQLDDRLDLLATAAAVTERHRSLRSTLDWSYRLLSETERAVLRRLSVFEGSFTMAATERICAYGGVHRDDLVDLISGLVSQSLLMVDAAGDESRYRLLHTVRLYAAQRLALAGERQRTVDLFNRWSLALVERVRRQPRSAIMALEKDNIAGALAGAVADRRTEDALALTSALTPLWKARAELGEGLRWNQAVAEIAGKSRERSVALTRAALFGLLAGDPQGALSMAEEALALVRGVDPAATATALNLVGLISVYSDPLRSFSLLHESLEMARAVQPTPPGALLMRSALAYWAYGDPLETRRLLDDCAGQLTVDDVAWGLGVGWAALADGDLKTASGALQPAMERARERGDRLQTVTALTLLSEEARARGDREAARALLDECLPRARDNGSPSALAACLVSVGYTRLAEGDLGGATLAFKEGAAAARKGWARLAEVQCLQGLGDVGWAADDDATSRPLFEEALAVATEYCHPRVIASCLYRLGALADRQGQLDAAATSHHEALRLRLESNDRAGIAGSLEAVAGLSSRAGSADLAIRLLGAAASIRDPSPVAADLSFAHDVAAGLREKVGDEQFGALWAEGASMSPAESVAYASKGRGRRGRGSGWHSLTDTEKRVAALVAEGMTNAEVAGRLFVGVATVKTHVTRILRKLDVPSRRELRTLVRDHGPDWSSEG